MHDTTLKNTPSAAASQGERPFSPLRIVTIVAFLLCVLYADTVRLSGDDFWLQAKIGEIIAQTHTIPDTLQFPFTEIVHEKFNAHEWLVSVIFHYALTALGEDGMPFLIGALGVALFVAMARLSYIRTQGNFAWALWGGFVSVLVENYRHVLRPELPSLLLMALLLINLEKLKSKPTLWPAFWSFLLIAIWANFHGSFILGPVVVGIFAFGQFLEEVRLAGWRWRKPSVLAIYLGLLFAASCAACLVTPFGWELIHFVFSFSVHSEASKQLTEWLPTFDHRMVGVWGFWIALAVWIMMAAFVFVGRKRLSMTDWLLFFAFSFLAYRAIRFPVYIGMVAAYVLPVCLPSSWTQKSKDKYVLGCGIAASALATVLVAIYGNAGRNSTYTLLDRTKFTIPMVQALDNPALQGNVLNTMELGAELIYRSYPRLRPSMDCRVDSYGFDYGNFNNALFSNDALLIEFVQRYDVRYVLLDTHRFESFIKLPSWNKGMWRIYFSDNRAVLLQRVDVVAGTPAG